MKRRTARTGTAGKLRIGDTRDVITIIALSQNNTLKAIAEFAARGAVVICPILQGIRLHSAELPVYIRPYLVAHLLPDHRVLLLAIVEHLPWPAGYSTSARSRPRTTTSDSLASSCARPPISCISEFHRQPLVKASEVAVDVSVTLQPSFPAPRTA
jgi:hypothetical protein